MGVTTRQYGGVSPVAIVVLLIMAVTAATAAFWITGRLKYGSEATTSSRSATVAASSSSASPARAKPRKLATAAYQSLSRLQAFTETGITYIEYRKQLGETWFAVKRFLDSNEVADDAITTATIRDVMGDYNTAALLWKAQVEYASSIDSYQRDGFANAYIPQLGEAEAAIPDLRERLNATGAKGTSRAVSILIEEYWRDASLNMRRGLVDVFR